jgi:type IV secretion system protein TrbJ
MSRFAISVVLAVVLSFAPCVMAGGYPVFDASNVAQAIKQVQNGLQQIEQLKTQIENQQKMLQGWNFSQIEGTLRRFDAVRGELDRAGQLYRDLDPRRALDRQFPTTFDTGAFTTTAPNESLRDQWVAHQRTTLEENRRLQNAVYADLAATRQRVGQYIEKSNSAPGMTAAVQANNELTATLIQQMQALQTLEITRSRAEVEAEAQRQSEEQYARQLRAWLNRNGTTTEPAEGHGTFAVEPIPETPILGGGR